MWIDPFQSTEKHEPVLSEVVQDHASIFWGIENCYDASNRETPWHDDVFNQDYSVLDLEYMARSGAKFCSPLVKMLLNEDGKLSDSAMEKISSAIVSKYHYNWQRLWATMSAEYNPIHNYNMSETRDLATTDDNVRDYNSTRTDTGTDTLTHGRVTDELDSVYGFNSGDSARPTDTYRTEESGDDVQTKNLTATDVDHRIDDNEGTEHETITRSGNIGVTTTQKMIEEERALWVWNYFEQVFKDLDRELTLPIYDPCRV